MVTAQRDYYKILGMPTGANAKTIKKAFHELAPRYHPDRNKDHDAEECFKEIAEAYTILFIEKRSGERDNFA